MKSLFFVPQGGKFGAVGVDVLPCRVLSVGGGGGIDHSLQAGKLVLGFAVIKKAFDEQPGADKKDRTEKKS